MKVLGVIPARGGSKGVPGKNLRLLCGRALIEYTFDAALKSDTLTDLVISTDSHEIAELACQNDVSVIKRPNHLAEDETPMMQVIAHAVEAREREQGEPYDYVVILQPTSPLRRAMDIDEVVKKMVNTGANCVVSVCQVREHPLRAKRIENDLLVDFADPEPIGGLRQSLPAAYRRNGAVYALRRDLVFVEDPIRKGDVLPYLMPLERSVDIDSWIDFRVAEVLLTSDSAEQSLILKADNA